MSDINYLAIVVAAVAVFVVSLVYYMAFSRQLVELSPAYAEAAESNARPPGWKMAIELVRNLILASVVAGLADLLDIGAWIDGAKLGLALWIGFPVVLWSGAVLWERVAPRLAVIHAGDWLLKLLLISVIVAVWR